LTARTRYFPYLVGREAEVRAPGRCHADFNTPETTEAGYFDGYGLAKVIGGCRQTPCATIPGFVPVREDRVPLAGVHDLETGER
jgi:arginase